VPEDGTLQLSEHGLDMAASLHEDTSSIHSREDLVSSASGANWPPIAKLTLKLPPQGSGPLMASLDALPSFNDIIRTAWQHRELRRPTAAALHEWVTALLDAFVAQGVDPSPSLPLVARMPNDGDVSGTESGANQQQQVGPNGASADKAGVARGVDGAALPGGGAGAMDTASSDPTGTNVHWFEGLNARECSAVAQASVAPQQAAPQQVPVPPRSFPVRSPVLRDPSLAVGRPYDAPAADGQGLGSPQASDGHMPATAGPAAAERRWAGAPPSD
jgi:hypothetical protein